VRPPLPVPTAPPKEPPITPGPLARTPPPAPDRNLAPSEWSVGDDNDPLHPRRTPRVGDLIFGFKLVSELGRGAFARVFLAHQEALAGRPVALKVSSRPTREAERLARLQHTNIVPVYSVHDGASVQVICMPFLGRTTIADLIRAYRIDHPSRPSARKSTSAARAVRTTTLDSKSRHGSGSASDPNGRSGSVRTPVWTWAADGPPPIIGDPRAVLEVLSQLAAGLAHAHERGILHLDLKPANVLLADTGEPMLLDFNLSFDAARPDRELVGGTVPYMAIEQLLDMRSRGTGTIDARTDLYALGVMAFEMLTGTVPFPVPAGGLRDLDALVATRRAGPPPLRPLNPAVTPAVEAIVRKLLAPDPADRYLSAAQLLTDIERHLADLPLVHAREASPRERFAKWRRRNPGVPIRMMAACLIGLTLGLGGVAHRKAEATARTGAVEQARATRAVLDTTRLDLILSDDSKARARGVARATELLAAYGLPDDADWRKRDAVRYLPESERTALAGDLGELLALLATVKWQAAMALPESERRQALAEAWKLLAAARTCFASDAVPVILDRQAAQLAPLAGEQFVAPANSEQPGDARALFLEAADALTHGRYASAEALLDRLVTAQPAHAAAQFFLAYCRHQSGKYQAALERYDIARAMLPTDPRPAFNRGLIYGLIWKPGFAEEEFTKALGLAPEHADAYRFRGLARLQLARKEKLAGAEADLNAAKEKLSGAEADLTAALKLGARPMSVLLVREQVRSEREDAAGAAADRKAVKDITPVEERDFSTRGWWRLQTRDADGALADFCKVLEFNPRSLFALQNQVKVYADLRRDNESALAAATNAVALYPQFAPVLASRAVVLARLGRREEAIKEIEKARTLSADSQISYAAACVYALTSVKHAEDRKKSFELLRQAARDAIRDGSSELRGLDSDPDLAAIRKDPEFQDIKLSAKSLLKK
jgi:serine/threonine protein kinase/predicted Zn-dependent protease